MMIRPIHVFATVLACLVVSSAWVKQGNAANECGETPIPVAAASMSPCLGAARNLEARVTQPCCSMVEALIRTAPRCLCDVILSPLARLAGLKPGIAITIPKRCDIQNRYVGEKCGHYVVP
ncbi:hypothetical protein RND81_11G202100 [Saponaria officinalis]|uniref:Bifunctional inhibitor/plant lipid transfer protein/seed storage helical domain-containing protein n=1 Tax=Saponaria officinalis TaxID=3572 RepID=A0AAW1HPX2_SAPOF